MPEQIKSDLQPFSEMAAKFALAALGEKRQEHDRYPHGELYLDAVRQARELGLFGVTLPAECGGNGLGLDVLCVILDEISRVDASMAGIIFTHTFAQEVMLAAGYPDRLRDIDSLIAFPSFGNPAEAGHLPAAARNGDGYVLDGSLEFLVLGSLASWAIIPAKIRDREEFSFFLVRLDRDGIMKSGPVQSLGMHACPAVDIGFNAVPADIVGGEDCGPQYFEAAADRLFTAAAAISSGIMKGAFREASEYSMERVQGGRVIANWSALRMILAEIAVKVEIADMAVTRACASVMEGSPRARVQARAAALHVQELSTSLTTDGIQVLGGYGYMKDFGQEKRFRDAKQAQSLLGIVPIKKLKLVEYLAGE